MTQEDLQRDVVQLEAMRKSLADSCEAQWQHHGMAASDDDVRDIAALDRAIEAARVLASMSNQQRRYLLEHCTSIAEDDEASIADLGDDAPTLAAEYTMTADAHRKVARLMGGAT